VSPNIPVGYNLVDSTYLSQKGNDSSILECKPGFFCPYVDPGNDLSMQPVVCPPTTECSLDRLSGRRCLVSSHNSVNT
jgi:hypothetical protein